jgi:redox-sensitive bicupin YhaK (pirin superfamily)
MQSGSIEIEHRHSVLTMLTCPLLLVLIAGQPLDQKVVQYGPFVMNTQAEVQQALMDFRSYSNGFERARGWQSEIGKDALRY